MHAFALVVAVPLGMLSGFGRFSWVFQCGAHVVALWPGLPGDYVRTAYYCLTLRKCARSSRISFGSFFAQSSASVDGEVYVGAYSVIGACEIGKRTQIASHVQILSGQHQHARGEDGRILGANEKEFRRVVIGSDCWVGAGAIIMADIGPNSTIGAGAVVTRPVPAGVVAVGNPARVLEKVRNKDEEK